MLKNFKGMPRTLNDFDVTANLNNATYIDYYERLKLLAMSEFEWVNLPETMNARFLEQTLYYFGMAAFVNDPELGFLSLKCVPSDYLNVYEEAYKYNVYSINYNREFNLSDMVLVRNNYNSLPTDLTIQLFARRLYEAERTIDVNIKTQKTPVLIMCDEKQRLTMQNIYQKYDGNIPIIFGDKNLDYENVKALKTDAPYVTDKLQEYKRNVWSEALTFLGVNNVNTEKKERLLTNEVDSNNQMIDLSAEVMLLTRKQAAEQFNKMYGTDIDVKLRTNTENNILTEEGEQFE